VTTVQDGIAALTKYFQHEADPEMGQIQVPNGPREARLLLAHAMGVPSERLTLLSYDPLDDDTLETAIIFAGRRRLGEPTSHIIGGREFYGRFFLVDRGVLDPRPETECLIAEALKEDFSEVLDLGTGSGAIAVTLLAERATAVAIATDVSEQALALAEKNSAAHGVSDRLGFEVSDWFEVVGGQFDLIVTNPPYIALDEMDGLQVEVLGYEPRMALTDEADGLTAYRVITKDAPAHLTPGGRLMFEIGPTQAAAVSGFMRDAGFEQIRVVPDLDGRDRVVVGYWQQQSV
jgi:release factor glutamine methyltransferase